MGKRPRALGFRMPAEWEPHAATWIAWPHNREDWPGKFQPIPWVYAEIVRHLARHEIVEIIVNDAEGERRARKVLESAGVELGTVVRFHRWTTDRVWTRDYGPIFLRKDASPRNWTPRNAPGEGPLLATTWRFNAWAKYPNWQNDAKVGAKIAASQRIPVTRPTQRLNGKDHRVVLEGGSIDVNGRGTLLTTEECLLSPEQARNPGISREQLEKTFADYLGISKVLWLGSGISGDDTHGHVDDLARFVSPDTVVAVSERDPADPNFAALEENLRRLRAMSDQDGKALRVVELPMPSAVTFQGRRLPASYANFYIANGLVLVPVFNDKNDRVALNILGELFPDREVLGIYCGDLIWGFGAIHCMTQQQPAA
ncbi:MAG TPA: agmatine deiminase family protein [Terriglobales bacterium]|nr:agmatine deiminase family protein [Terriglobales bacterium]